MGAPDFYTVEEAADLLRIGRTAAYLAAKQYRVTGGAEGLPVIAIRGSLRVPRRRLEAWAGGPLGEHLADVIDIADRLVEDAPPMRTARATKRRAASSASNQGSLPFTD